MAIKAILGYVDSRAIKETSSEESGPHHSGKCLLEKI
jgi:hypothetical protein